MKVPCTTGLVSDIKEDQDQQQDQEADFAPEDSATGIPILNDEINVEVTTENRESLCQNSQKAFGFEPFSWTVLERESVFHSDSDE